MQFQFTETPQDETILEFASKDKDSLDKALRDMQMSISLLSKSLESGDLTRQMADLYLSHLDYNCVKLQNIICFDGELNRRKDDILANLKEYQQRVKELELKLGENADYNCIAPKLVEFEDWVSKQLKTIGFDGISKLSRYHSPLTPGFSTSYLKDQLVYVFFVSCFIGPDDDLLLEKEVDRKELLENIDTVSQGVRITNVLDTDKTRDYISSKIQEIIPGSKVVGYESNCIGRDREMTIRNFCVEVRDCVSLLKSI